MRFGPLQQLLYPWYITLTQNSASLCPDEARGYSSDDGHSNTDGGGWRGILSESLQAVCLQENLHWQQEGTLVACFQTRSDTKTLKPLLHHSNTLYCLQILPNISTMAVKFEFNIQIHSYVLINNKSEYVLIWVLKMQCKLVFICMLTVWLPSSDWYSTVCEGLIGVACRPALQSQHCDLGAKPLITPQPHCYNRWCWYSARPPSLMPLSQSVLYWTFVVT